MKQILFLISAVVLISCSKNEMQTKAVDNQTIGFANYVGKGTSASTTVVNAEGSAFGVFAWEDSLLNDAYYAPEFMKNQKVSYSQESGWTYSPVQYWPLEGGLDFMAYWPYTEDIILEVPDDDGDIVFQLTYEQSATLGEMKDLVYALAVNQTILNTSGGTVEFDFVHTFSRLSFSVKPATNLATKDKENSTFITITDLTVRVMEDAVYNKVTGTFKKDGGIGLLFGDSYFAKDTQWQLSNIADSTSVITGASGIDLVPDGFTLSDASTTAQSFDAMLLTTASEYIFLPPQDHTGDGKDNLYIDLSYDVTTFDDALGAITFTGYSESIALDLNYYSSVAYNVVIVIGPDAIEFGEPIITNDWGSDYDDDYYMN